jgi:hypothetical protein
MDNCADKYLGIKGERVTEGMLVLGLKVKNLKVLRVKDWRELKHLDWNDWMLSLWA